MEAEQLKRLRDALSTTIRPISEEEKTALENLLAIAQGDTGQSGRVANFLLAWWNGNQFGKFDLTEFWGLDKRITEDMQTVIGFICRRQMYPDVIEGENGTLDYTNAFKAIIKEWRS